MMGPVFFENRNYEGEICVFSGASSEDPFRNNFGTSQREEGTLPEHPSGTGLKANKKRKR